MKRNKFFLVATAVAVLFALVATDRSANAQSKDRDNPTRLTSNEISGMIDSDSIGNFYYYSFMAEPGEVSITLTVEPGRRLGGGFKSVRFALFDRNAAELASKSAYTFDGGGTKQVIARVDVTRRQRMVLSIDIPDAPSNEGVGKYRFRIDGAVSFGQDTSPSDFGIAEAHKRDNIDNPECLPKKGILRVKMKDGSIRRIDLSQAEEITIEH